MKKYVVKVLIPFLIFIVASLPLFAQTYKPEILQYVKYLQRPSTNPIDYVMELFEKYDIVILCERFHPEYTQYELISALVKDNRFIEQVGNVFTEIGTSSNRKRVIDFLTNPNLTKKQIEETLLGIYRDLSWMSLWVNTNLYDFLRNVQIFNRGLPPESMVRVYPSDMPFSWDGMTSEGYKKFEETLDSRDRIMADEIEKEFRRILDSEPRKKALVIMNYRHAFNDFPLNGSKKGNNTGRFLFERFPGRVANVFLNSVALLPGTTDQKSEYKPIQDGKWDAAFHVMGNIECGFDFSNTPFGKDSFDLFPFTPHQAKYQDVFTGMIFYIPLSHQKSIFGIPGLFDESFKKTFLQRMEIRGRKISAEELERTVSFSNQLSERLCFEAQKYKSFLDQWLKNPQ